MLQKRYQALLINHLKEWINKDIQSDNPDSDLMVFSDPAVMKSFFDDLKKEYQNGFYVNITKERHDLKSTIGYIGRYARRPPLSEVRIKDYTGDWVSFEFKDYKNNGSKVLHSLKTIEFIKKLVRHIPPHYFNLIRHYGIMASRVKAVYKKITDKILGNASGVKEAQNWRERQTAFRGQDPLVCRICQKVMVFVSAHFPNSLSAVKARMQAAFS